MDFFTEAVDVLAAIVRFPAGFSRRLFWRMLGNAPGEVKEDCSAAGKNHTLMAADPGGAGKR